MSLRLLPRRPFWAGSLKRRLPTSLFGRSLLIIVLPVALMQVAVTWVFFDAHWQTVTSRLSEGLAGDIAWAVESYQDDPTPASLAAIAERAERVDAACPSPCSRAATLPDATAGAASVFASIDRSLDGRWPSGWTSPSGSTPPATRPTSTSGSSSRRACCASSPRATGPSPPRATSSCSG